jgi:hypothetical protein
MPRTVYKIHPDAPARIVRAGLTKKGFAERAGITESTLHALLNPEQHPIAAAAACSAPPPGRSYAGATGLSEDETYGAIVESMEGVALHARPVWLRDD